jgi:hypothetical protein
MSNTFIAVEGPHDVEFIAGISESLGYSKVSQLNQLDLNFARRLVKTSYPHKGDLYQRMPNPMFLQNGEHWLAIQSAGGETPKLLETLHDLFEGLKPLPDVLNSVGIIRDADDLDGANQFKALLTELQAKLPFDGYDIRLPDGPGLISDSSPRLGVFVFPDNAQSGALEQLLLECGEKVYPNLIAGAKTYVASVDLEKLNAKDKSLFKKPHGREKATVACAADILKPGMAIATSIDQNRWLCDETLQLPKIEAIKRFLQELCGLN